MRLRTPSARTSAAMWIFVVASAMAKARAISLLDLPRTRSESTSRWRFVNLKRSASVDSVASASPSETAAQGIAVAGLGERPRHIDAPGQDVRDGGKNIGVGLMLRNEAMKPGGQAGENIRPRVRCRDDREAGRRRSLARCLQGIERPEAGQVHAHENQIEGAVTNLGQCFDPAARLDHLGARNPGANETAQPRAVNILFVKNQNSSHSRTPSFVVLLHIGPCLSSMRRRDRHGLKSQRITGVIKP